MKIWAKIISEQHSDVYIKELPNGIQLNYILNVGDILEIADNSYIVSKRLINSYADTSKYLPFIELLLMPIISDNSKKYYNKLYAKIAIEFFVGERYAWCSGKNVTIKNQSLEINDFITAVIPNSENDFIKIEAGKDEIDNDLYCRFRSISNYNNKNMVINIEDEKIKKKDLFN